MNIQIQASLWLRLSSALGAGCLAALITLPWWLGVSVWAGVAIALTAATLVDMYAASRDMVPIPHVAILICLLQYGLAAWASHYYPSSDSECQIPNLHDYFAYAGPVLLAIALGWALAGVGLSSRSPASSGRSPGPALVRELDWLLWGGLLVSFFGGRVNSGGLSFFILLLANLRFIGAIGLMLISAPNWKRRVGALLFFELLNATGTGMFHDFVLWVLSLFAVYLFVRRPTRGAFFLWVAFGSFGVFLLQDVKWTIRRGTWEEGGAVVVFGQPMEYSRLTRPFVAGLCLVESATKLFTTGYSDELLGDSATRFNQGWIIAKVMRQVPATEPYARGETLWRGLEACLLPRFLAPNKLISGGRLYMERFAGHTLQEGTSMNLGFAGEMYANFGLWGGVAGCAGYAFLVGLLFRLVAVRARVTPLWWAIAVYAGHTAFKAEDDIGTVFNYVVKSAAVAAVLITFLPALHDELTGRKPLDRMSLRRIRKHSVKPAKAAAVPTDHGTTDGPKG